MAEGNWWGTPIPFEYLEKFAGLVDYRPWLPEPPREEGGGQSAIINKPNPTFALYAPKPNPATKELKITYSLSSRCKSELIIWDVSGRIVTKTTEEKEPGQYEYLWQGKDQRGKAVPNGIYFVRLKAENNLQTQKITLTR
ncbi:MAG: T9SS type A sorting domain-containing protein [candidate division WOR-3 bacterium]|nr:T9SS type A sorting domain-containing protein [candidate division WOR-3 bacterium]MDH5683806.1 T9SS type A sorting domain-containing protein [candidate division WOR-3 bacterium]